LLDDGRLTDAQVRVVDFKNTIVIMTSNVGATILLEAAKDGVIDAAEEEAVSQELKRHIRPEFLNGIDDTILFHPLHRTEIERIIDKAVEKMTSRLSGRGITLQVTDAAKTLIFEEAFEPQYGVRPINRYMQRTIETKLARVLLSGAIQDGSQIAIDVADGELVVNG
jgi:ATP-dependent Clp protease ATP-binding subunit ClpB